MLMLWMRTLDRCSGIEVKAMGVGMVLFESEGCRIV